MATKKKKKSTKRIVERSREVQNLSEKYANQMHSIGLHFNSKSTLPVLNFKKCSILDSDEFIFINSSQLNSSTGI